MVDILHRVGVVASARRRLPTPWRRPRASPAGGPTDTVGESEVGGQLAFRFGDGGGFDMEVLELDPAGRCGGRSSTAPRSGSAPRSTGDLDQRGEYTIVLFTHEGWREPVEFMHHCSTKWATFLMSLKELVETGHGTPAPDDVQISDWH